MQCWDYSIALPLLLLLLLPRPLLLLLVAAVIVVVVPPRRLPLGVCWRLPPGGGREDAQRAGNLDLAGQVAVQLGTQLGAAPHRKLAGLCRQANGKAGS